MVPTFVAVKEVHGLGGWGSQVIKICCFFLKLLRLELQQQPLKQLIDNGLKPLLIKKLWCYGNGDCCEICKWYYMFLLYMLYIIYCVVLSIIVQRLMPPALLLKSLLLLDKILQLECPLMLLLVGWLVFGFYKNLSF